MNSWSRAERLALVGILVAIAGVILALLNPEIRAYLGLNGSPHLRGATANTLGRPTSTKAASQLSAAPPQKSISTPPAPQLSVAQLEKSISTPPVPQLSVAQPEKAISTPPAPQPSVPPLQKALATLQGEGTVHESRTADIKLKCDKPNMDNGDWYWGCHIINSSKNIIWWRDSFQNKGSELGWYCLENADSTCTAFTLEDEKIDVSVDGSMRFNYLNPHESLDFWINCRGEPLMCGVQGRAPGIFVEGASFSHTHNG